MKRVLRPRNPCTRAELERAIAMHERMGLPWSVIADRLGKEQNTLEVTVSRFRNGQWGDGIERRAQRDAAIERFIAETGAVEVPVIARAFGMSLGGTYSALGRLGLDREMREELAASAQDLRRAA